MHPNGLILIEVALNDSSRLECDLPIHQMAQTLDHTPLHLIDGVAWINDLSSNVARHPNMWHTHLPITLNTHFRHFCKVPEVAEVACDAERR